MGRKRAAETANVAYSVLVVDVDRNALQEAATALADAGYLVTQATTFADARQRLVLSKPDLLITAVRLAGFNGLHLVVTTRAMLPNTVAVVTHAVLDSALQADAARHNAIYMVQPVDWPSFLEVVASALGARGERRKNSRPRRWTRKTPADHVGATLGASPGSVVDLSYGGVRLQMTGRVTGPSDAAQTLALPEVGISVHARPVWMQGAGPDGPWLCGVEVQERDPTANRAWRAFVDRVGS
jgi:DNA-binding response OmpR family regulator